MFIIISDLELLILKSEALEKVFKTSRNAIKLGLKADPIMRASLAKKIDWIF